MNILAFDTCFGACSVAVRRTTARGEVIVREEYEERITGHAEALIPMIERVMTGAGLAFATLDRIAVTEGPGGFTGVRIGVATARGFGVALGKPIVAMSSLMVMALRADHLLAGRRWSSDRGAHEARKRAGRTLAVCVDARKGQVYAQLFGENGGDAQSDPMLVTPAELAVRLDGREFLAVGSGAKAVVDAAGATGSSAPGRCEALLPALEPHARMLALLGPGLAVRPILSPLYLRPPDAKPRAAGLATLLTSSQARPRAGA